MKNILTMILVVLLLGGAAYGGWHFGYQQGQREITELQETIAEQGDTIQALEEDYQALQIQNNALQAQYDGLEADYAELLNAYQAQESIPWSEKQAMLEYLSRPENWLQYGLAAELGLLPEELAAEAPMVVPEVVAKYTTGLELGTPISELNPEAGYQISLSAQTWHGMSPTEQAQITGWLEAGWGGKTLEELLWQWERLAPPGGGGFDLYWVK